MLGRGIAVGAVGGMGLVVAGGVFHLVGAGLGFLGTDRGDAVGDGDFEERSLDLAA